MGRHKKPENRTIADLLSEVQGAESGQPLIVPNLGGKCTPQAYISNDEVGFEAVKLMDIPDGVDANTDDSDPMPAICARLSGKQMAVVRLHLQGVMNQDIADVMGYTKTSVVNALKSEEGRAYKLYLMKRIDKNFDTTAMLIDAVSTKAFQRLHRILADEDADLTLVARVAWDFMDRAGHAPVKSVKVDVGSDRITNADLDRLNNVDAEMQEMKAKYEQSRQASVPPAGEQVDDSLRTGVHPAGVHPQLLPSDSLPNDGSDRPSVDGPEGGGGTTGLREVDPREHGEHPASSDDAQEHVHPDS